ncbi:hypothetical protein [Sorangium sp. So ce233]|uniref:hypothetical protein n=1 Tax=Sorangium sp. So ce233 TaxID=3133290 RepID=UPI003F63D1B7
MHSTGGGRDGGDSIPGENAACLYRRVARVTEFAVKFGHHERAPDFGHYQWNVDAVQLEDTNEGVRLRLSGSRLMPVFTISFAGVEMRKLDNSTLDRRFPGWSKPGASFIRSGIEQQVEEKKRKP